MHAFGSSQTLTVLLLFVFRDEVSVQNGLLTSDQLLSITHTQSVSETVCQLYNAWLYLFTLIFIVI